ncbi:hypothetical protein R1sor_027241 [Riccia sorocarpa]|uniref:Endonuclease/exonuclease/phosphatase domain-containing protein n=1 Tax=Riccia sorocarpa TaxID=122646 RepID=A0ABD3GDN1_9MARC
MRSALGGGGGLVELPFGSEMERRYTGPEVGYTVQGKRLSECGVRSLLERSTSWTEYASSQHGWWLLVNLRDQGAVVVMGDFNSRIGSFQGRYLLPLEGRIVEEDTEVEQGWERMSADVGRNGLSPFFQRMVSVCDLVILNGVSRFPDTSDFTCRTSNGASVIDFVLACKSGRELVTSLTLGQFLPESDHCPLNLTLALYAGRSKVRKRSPRLQLDNCRRLLYEASLALRIRGEELTASSLPPLIMQVAETVFGRSRESGGEWFDEGCRSARQRLLQAPDEKKGEMCRAYKNMIRAKKRCYIRKQQLRLKEELRSRPQLFWSKLKPPRCRVVDRLHIET